MELDIDEVIRNLANKLADKEVQITVLQSQVRALQAKLAEADVVAGDTTDGE